MSEKPWLEKELERVGLTKKSLFKRVGQPSRGEGGENLATYTRGDPACAGKGGITRLIQTESRTHCEGKKGRTRTDSKEVGREEKGGRPKL